MSSKAVDYKIILKRDGQTQNQRLPLLLDGSLVQIDDRTKAEFLDYVKSIAGEINFYELSQGTNTMAINGGWQEFFNLTADELDTLSAQASLPPHIALWNAFIELYDQPKQLMNTLTKRHLDFYYGEVLRLQKNDPFPDTAHVVFELKKNADDILLTAGTPVLAGKDITKKDLHYNLTHDIIVNNSKLAQLKSLYVNPGNRNFVGYAPIANSSDGLGAKLDKNNPKWTAFGNPGLPAAQIGFCLASDVLLMKEGDRTVTVKLTIGNLANFTNNGALTANLFKISITGEKGWIGPKTVSPVITTVDNKNFTASFSFNLTKDEPAVITYSPSLHGNVFETNHPILQVLVNNEKYDFGYNDLFSAELIDTTIEVQVNGVQQLDLENDFGTLNPKKSFTPFGPTPEVNANFSVGSVEAFSKRLKEFHLDVQWKNIPDPNLANYFNGYEGSNGNSDFTATPSFQDGFGWKEESGALPVFNTTNAQANSRWSFTNPAFPVKLPILNLPNLTVRSYAVAGQSLEQRISGKMAQLVPAFASLQVKPFVFAEVLYRPSLISILNSYREARQGMFNLCLKHNFLFKEYPKKYTAEILRSSRAGDEPHLVQEPFSPEIQSITLNYTATTAKINFNGTTLNDYVDEEIEFFHYGAFGQMREHAYARNQNSFLNNTIVKLLPAYTNEGEFFIGFSNLNAEDSVCVLFQVAEGSANPAKSKVDLKWSVLCDNYWKDMTDEDFIFDTTNDLLTSGVIKFVMPPEATNSNTIMPSGLLWLKAAIGKDSDAVCSLVDVQSNAAITVFDNQGNDASHFANPLSASTINKLETDVGSVKTVKQPYASFGGKIQEDDEQYYTRVSERLRHKERSITLWDYERLILQHFPNVYKAKCINHASPDSFYAPGHVLVVVVPDLTNQNAINPFQPQVDKNTLDNITVFLQNHSSSWVTHHVTNPFYEPVKISVKIKLRKGFEFNYYQKIIDLKLQEFLSPWISGDNADVHFGGKITKSMIVKFLENLEFVDFISDLFLFQSVDGIMGFNNTEVAEASNPASILVSNDHHEISSL